MEWNDFDNLVKHVIVDVKHMDDDTKFSVATELGLCRHQIDKKPRRTREERIVDESRVKSCRPHFEDEAFNRLGNETLERLVCFSEMARTSSSHKSHFMQRYQQKTSHDAQLKPTRERRWFDTTRSMSRVNVIMFMVLEAMLAKLKDRNDLMLFHTEFSPDAFEEYRLLDSDPGARGISPWKTLDSAYCLSNHPTMPFRKLHLPYATFELKGSAHVLMEWKSECEPTYKPPNDGDDLNSAEVVAKFCNACFRKALDADGENIETPQDGGSKRVAFLKLPQSQAIPIANAVAQGLINKSGCSILYNYQNVIAFKVCNLDEKGEKVKILVLRMYPCDEPYSTLPAMLALMIHSLALCHKSDHRKERRRASKLSLQRLYDQTRVRLGKDENGRSKKRTKKSERKAGSAKRRRISTSG